MAADGAASPRAAGRVVGRRRRLGARLRRGRRLRRRALVGGRRRRRWRRWLLARAGRASGGSGSRWHIGRRRRGPRRGPALRRAARGPASRDPAAPWPCARSSSPRAWRSGSSRCRCRSAAVSGDGVAWRRSSARRAGLGWSALVFEAVGDAQLAAYKRDPRPRPGHGPRPVALHPAPQLLRRRLRLVGHLAGRRLASAGCRRCSPSPPPSR